MNLECFLVKLESLEKEHSLIVEIRVQVIYNGFEFFKNLLSENEDLLKMYNDQQA